jgi:heptosyltransferase III
MYKPKILVARMMALGDVILTTPIIRELYERHNGQVEITVATRYPEVFKNNPYVSNVIEPMDVNVGLYNQFINLDLSYEQYPKQHIIESYKRIAFGETAEIDPAMDLIADADDIKLVEKFIKDNVKTKDFIVVHIRKGGWPSRQLSEDFWGDLLEPILDNHDVSIVQVGAPDEGSFSGDDKLVNALGVFSIQQLKELIARAKAYVGIDSAPTHIAGCTTTPNFTFFTAVKAEYRKTLANPKTFFPIETELECYGCHGENPPPATEFKCRRPTVECVDSFDAEEVYKKIAKVL